MPNILVIENNSDVATSISAILELDNYSVLHANDGVEGVNIALKEKPDLIVCNVRTPLLDGYGVLNILQKYDNTLGRPFIFLSNSADPKAIRRGMNLGADDFLISPFSSVELLHAIEVRLNKIQRLRSKHHLNSSDKLMPTGNKTVAEKLEKLRSGRDAIKFKRRQLIFSVGNHPVYLYYIEKGWVKTCLFNEEGKEIITRIYGAGEFLGYEAALNGTTYSEQAESLCTAELVPIPFSEFNLLVYSDIEVLKLIVRWLTSYLSNNQKHLLKIAYNSLRKRVADALLYLHRKNHGLHYMEVPGINRDVLASLAGVAKESLIRTLSDFRNEGLINIQDGRINLPDIRRLEEMVN
ncbi:response regulator [Chitinophaga pollutisoli]|uniref:Response regulator n=1 Tax=Chitinophaga pollutisoli TaxID=3133966 RepID=A0ABZ2YP68_9BACT